MQRFRFYGYLLVTLFLIGCGGPEPRRPKEVKSGSYYEESIERNKEILALEEKMMEEIIQKDSLHMYQHSASGSWYYYDFKNDEAGYLPQPDDLVTLVYNIVSFENDTIYSMEDIGVQKYKVDKQELFPGLRNSVKLLKEGETATFLFPSSLGYGYPGDGDKIGINMPLKSTLSILKIEPSASQSNE
ncbi:gliding motility-associated peptidyl-prolyl isomerase GldI [Flavobacteriaceae bacterium TP-CH-4]|uniref:Peptidyl-prolyl cis-trans isomerase n=1 Tax=Pelagihabitans pacificus TaxID=2696054 RepID=A0A967AWE4_9FLAO|nr:gliding motility-associated peptidyl-prolyl isomerase GldI [Pelagihabitans pacificus]